MTRPGGRGADGRAGGQADRRASVVARLHQPSSARPPVRSSAAGGALATALLAVAIAAAGPGVAAAQRPVERVVIERRSVFDSAEAAQEWWRRLVNGTHFITKTRVIRREVLLRPGQPFDSARAAESARNLRGLGIFRRALVDTLTGDSGVIVRVRTDDGFAHRARVEFGSVGAQTTYNLGYTNVNFLGWDGLVSLNYRRNPDRAIWSGTWSQPRLVLDRVGFRVNWQDRSDGRVLSANVSQPFFAYQSRSAAGVSALDFDGDVLRFRDGNPAASSVLRRRYALVSGEVALALRATPREFVRVGLVGQWRRDDFVPAAAVPALFPRSVTGALGGYVSWSRARFAVQYNVESSFREEDLDLSTSARLGVWAAPAAFGYARDGAGVDVRLRHGVALPGGAVIAGVNANGLVDAAGLDSGRVRAFATAILKPFGRAHTLVLHAQGGLIRNPLPGDEFDLGLGFGPRAFPLHAFTGDRLYFLTGEYRYLVAEDLYGLVGLGGALFVDHGGAWWSDGPGARQGTNAGLGLRVGPSRLTTGTLGRIDLSYRFRNDRLPGGFVVSVGQGFAF
ncbi:MAG: hypothetical protein SFU84_06790 [Gemmatimonadales bacterium]|nr:hypothetical protein [Gemmatimonadales bacterium]